MAEHFKVGNQADIKKNMQLNYILQVSLRILMPELSKQEKLLL